MDSTTANDEQGHSTPRPTARPTGHETGGTARESALAEILVARHQQLLTSNDLSIAPDSLRPWRNEPGADALTAEVEELEECLRVVERSRRHACSAAVLGHAALPDRSCEQPAGPDQIGRFEIERELGRGGLGVVLLAHDPVLRRRVALKVPRPEALLTPDLRKRFQREAQAAARLTHSHIVPVYEVGEAGAICFIAAEFVTGPNLGEWLRLQAGPIDPHAAAALVADLAGAMDYAHCQGVLHRDLKPTNILLERRGIPEAAGATCDLTEYVGKITDFGLARLADRAGDETRSGAIIGTPAYMSPEQAMGATRSIGPASDVYSLGAILYELLAGRPPFRGESDAMTLVQVIGEEPPSVRRLRPELPRDLEAICLRALAKDPQRRYASAGELAADLGRFLRGEPTVARPLSVAQSLACWARRRPAHAALVALATAALAAILGGAAFYTARLDRALQLAESNESKAVHNQGLAEREAQRANLELYAAQMRMANLAIERESYARASQILAAYDSDKPLAHLRGAEWHILQAQAERAEHKRDRGLSTLLKHPDEVYTVRFLPGTSLLATGAQDGHVRFWDYHSQTLVHDLKQHSSCVNQVRFSPDGAWMATTSCDKTMILWRMSKEKPPEPVHTFVGEAPMRALDFSPDGATLAAGDEQGLLRFFDPGTGDLQCTRQIDTNLLDDLSWSRDGKRLAISVYSQLAPYWMGYVDGDDRQPVDMDHEPLMAADVAYSPDGKRLAINDRNLRLRQFATDSRLELATAESESVQLTGLAWSPDSSYLATIGGSGDIRIYDAVSGKLRESIEVHTPGGHYEDLTFDPSGRLLASAARDGSLFVTQVGIYDEARPVFQVKSLPGYRSRARLDGALKRLSLVACTGYREWALDMGEMIIDRPLCPADAIASDSIAAGTSHVISLANHEVILHDLKQGTARKIPDELATNAHQAYLLAESPPLLALVCAASPGDWANNQLRIVDGVSFRELDCVPCGFGGHAFSLSPDRRFLVRTLTSGGLDLFDFHTGRRQPFSSAGQAGFSDVGFSLDGRQLMAQSNFEVWLWDMKSLTLKHTFRGHSVATAAFSPDGQTLAILSDHDITLAHTATGHEMVKLPLSQHLARKASWTRRFAMSLTFSADNRRLALVSDDRHRGVVEVYVWGSAE